MFICHNLFNKEFMELYIEGKSIEFLHEVEYVIIQIKMNAWGTKMLFFVDAGNDFKSTNQITNSKGESILFNSEGDVMNYMFACGFEYVNNYTMKKSSGETMYKFIFRRMIKG